MKNKISSVRPPVKHYNDRWIISVEYPNCHDLVYTFFGTEKQASAKMNRLSRQLADTPVLALGLYEMDEWFACNDIKHVLD